jgi:hypothetical protein
MAQQFIFDRIRGIIPAEPVTKEEAQNNLLKAVQDYAKHYYDPYRHTYVMDVLEDIVEEIEDAFDDVKDAIIDDIMRDNEETHKIKAQAVQSQM